MPRSPWILRTVDLHCMPVSAAGLMRIFTKFHIGTIALHQDVRPSAVARNSFWNVEPLDARRTHAYYGISTTPLFPRFSSKSKRSNANAKSSSLPSIRYQICQICRLSHARRSRVHPLQNLAFLLLYDKNKNKNKNMHMQFPRNNGNLEIQILKISRHPMGRYEGAFSSMQAGCCSLKCNLSPSFPSLLGAQRTS
jgi:hypothetical protein